MVFVQFVVDVVLFEWSFLVIYKFLKPTFWHHCWRNQASNVLGQMLRFRRVMETAKDQGRGRWSSCEVDWFFASSLRMILIHDSLWFCDCFFFFILIGTCHSCIHMERVMVLIVLIYIICVPWTISWCCPVDGQTISRIRMICNKQHVNDYCLRFPSLTLFVKQVCQQHPTMGCLNMSISKGTRWSIINNDVISYSSFSGRPVMLSRNVSCNWNHLDVWQVKIIDPKDAR